jgi:multiple sugar transport system substrate-binding protein
MKISRWKLGSLMLAVVLALSGCGGGGAGVENQAAGGDGAGAKTQQPAKSASLDIDASQPIAISAYRVSTGMTPDEFNQFIADPVKKRYPNVTLTFSEAAAGNQPADLVASGQIPDLLITDQGGMRTFTDLHISEDLAPIMKKYNVDINKYEPAAIELAKGLSLDGNQLVGIPFSLNFSGFFYNKDVFDKFAVPYPKDGMDWDDIIELGKRVAREDSGISYKALYPNPVKSVSFDNGINVVDAKTTRSNFMTDDWKAVFQTYVNILKIPGNLTVPTPTKLFQDAQLAMMSSGVARIGEFDKLYKEGHPVNWDVIAHPKIAKYKSTGLGSVSPAYLLPSVTSKNKDTVFKIILAVTEKDNQIAMTKQGRLSGLSDKQIRDQFGQGMESMKGKNVKGMLALPFALGAKYTIYDNVAGKYLDQAAKEVAQGTKDVNTALREAQEQANKDIEGLEQGK